jgi:hypothetical protein
MYSGKSAPSTYAIDAANQIGIDQNVLNTMLAKLRCSNFSKIAPAINTNIMPQLIPDRNPELIFPPQSSRGATRSLIKFLDEGKQRYPGVFRSICRFQQYLNESCYCHADKTKYKPHYHKEGDNSIATSSTNSTRLSPIVFIVKESSVLVLLDLVGTHMILMMMMTVNGMTTSALTSIRIWMV